MRHTYSCTVRWGDMDTLGHVNNVRFADYLQEARVDLLRVHGAGAPTDDLAEGPLVVAQQLTYHQPLVFDARPVNIDVWVAQIRAASFTLAYEVYRDGPEGRTTYLTASTLLTQFSFATERPRRINAVEKEQLTHFLEPTELPVPEWTAARHEEVGHYPVRVRFSDLDVYGHANNVIYLEYFQEARINQMSRQVERSAAAGGLAELPSFVVAAQHLEYKRPMVLRAEPYDSWVWVQRIGTTSLALQSEIVDLDGTVVARGHFVLVSVDPHTGAAAPFDDAFRAAFEPADQPAG